MDVIRVLVVDDHPVVRRGLVAILRYEPGFEVAGEAADGEEALAQIRAGRPDVVLLDLRLPKIDGVAVMQRARAEGLPARFLVLTTYDTDEYIAPALAAGAQGYLLKDATPEELTRAVRVVMQGRAALEPGVAARLLERMAEGHRADELSPREVSVLELLVQGASNKAIGAQLDLSENTVKSHLSRIFAKLGVQSRAEAVSVAIQRGLIRSRR